MAFNGKVALVTGGGSGMGRVAARKLAEQGAQVAIFDVNEEELQQSQKIPLMSRGSRVSQGQTSRRS